MKKEFEPSNFPIAAFDLDDTLLFEGNMSPAVEDALARLRQSGTITVISSGRDGQQLSSFLLEKFDYVVANSGATIFCSKTNEFFSADPFQKEDLLSAQNTIEQCGGESVLFLWEEMRASEKCIPRLFNYVYDENGKAVFSYKTLTSPSLPEFIREDDRPVYKIKTFFLTEDDCRKAETILLNDGRVEVQPMPGHSLEIQAKGITKAAGLKKLAALLGYSEKNIVAFGDSRNDLEMILLAGYSVVMSNGSDEVKQYADYIAEDVRDDGAAKAILDLYRL